MKYTKVSAFLLAGMILIAGCTPVPKSPMHLFPDEKGQEGYYRLKDSGVFESKAVKISVSLLEKTNPGIDPMVSALLDKDFVVVRMDIVNYSPVRAMYNPAYTALMSDSFDYRKPLDYTDIYDMTANIPGFENGIAKLKGKFYDLNETVNPGEKSSKLLIFKPLSKDIKTAELSIKEVYIGTETIRLTFPFVLKAKVI